MGPATVTGPAAVLRVVLARTLNMDVKYGIVFHSSVKGSLYESTALGGGSMNLKRLEK